MPLHTDLLMLRSPHLSTPHGFSTRFGGVSGGIYAAERGGGLNVDDRLISGEQDDPAAVAHNRERLLSALGGGWELSLLNQVHEVEVVHITAPLRALPTADAQVSCASNVMLGILTADCYPLLLHDPHAKVIGAAHAGWRGTLGNVAARTLAAMCDLGARPERVRVAIGPGISMAHYAVGPEVAQAVAAAGLGAALGQAGPSGTPLNLAAANATLLQLAGVLPKHLWAAQRCTTESDFYSYRRDHGKTGRMLALIGQRGPVLA